MFAPHMPSCTEFSSTHFPHSSSTWFGSVWNENSWRRHYTACDERCSVYVLLWCVRSGGDVRRCHRKYRRTTFRSARASSISTSSWTGEAVSVAGWSASCISKQSAVRHRQDDACRGSSCGWFLPTVRAVCLTTSTLRLFRLSAMSPSTLWSKLCNGNSEVCMHTFNDELQLHVELSYYSICSNVCR